MEGVKAALQSGVDVNTKDETNPASMFYGQTGLISAVSYYQNSVVELLLKTPNIDVNLKSDRGRCALYEAVRSENNEALKLLLNVPTIDVNIVDNNGDSALHRVVADNNVEALRLLLNVPNINVNIANKIGSSPVYLAVYWDHIEALKLLLDVPNIDVNFALACRRRKWRLVKKNNNEALKLLLNVPSIDVNMLNKLDGGSAVHVAVKTNNIEALKLLLSHPSLTALTLNQKQVVHSETCTLTLNMKFKEKSASPVMQAVMRNSWEQLALLAADPRVDLDTTDWRGRSLDDMAR